MESGVPDPVLSWRESVSSVRPTRVGRRSGASDRGWWRANRCGLAKSWARGRQPGIRRRRRVARPASGCGDGPRPGWPGLRRGAGWWRQTAGSPDAVATHSHCRPQADGANAQPRWRQTLRAKPRFARELWTVAVLPRRVPAGACSARWRLGGRWLTPNWGPRRCAALAHRAPPNLARWAECDAPRVPTDTSAVAAPELASSGPLAADGWHSLPDAATRLARTASRHLAPPCLPPRVPHPCPASVHGLLADPGGSARRALPLLVFWRQDAASLRIGRTARQRQSRAVPVARWPVPRHGGLGRGCRHRRAARCETSRQGCPSLPVRGQRAHPARSHATPLGTAPRQPSSLPSPRPPRSRGDSRRRVGATGLPLAVEGHNVARNRRVSSETYRQIPVCAPPESQPGSGCLARRGPTTRLQQWPVVPPGGSAVTAIAGPTSPGSWLVQNRPGRTHPPRPSGPARCWLHRPDTTAT